MKSKIFLSLLFFHIFIFTSISQAVDMTVEVDMESMKRGLLITETEYSVQSGTVPFYYPEWIPGIHGPRNAISNLAEIFVETPDGERLDWVRDPKDVFRFLIEVPDGINDIIIKTVYICNQPTTNSRGVDSYGYPVLAAINWNTCLLYPEGKPVHEIDCDVSITLPPDWKLGSSLKEKNKEEDTIHFETVTLEELIDSPVIAGEYFKTIDLTPDAGPPHYIHLVSESNRALNLEEQTIQALKNLVLEGMELFGFAPFPEYHFLLILSDSVPGLGLEHHKSSLNSRGEYDLIYKDQIAGTGVLLAHEYTHAWCGKYRRPEGMVTPDYNTPKDTRLLWVYEGLDTYLGEMLGARSGLIAKEDSTVFEEAQKRFGKNIIRKKAQKGRRAITLEDTASSAYIRRGWSDHWQYLIRPQDYYVEGMFMWMHIDSILRKNSDGNLSLDDFIADFLGEESDQWIFPFEQSDIIESLNQLHEYDWETLIIKRVNEWHEELPLEFVNELGYRVQYKNEPTDIDENMIFTSLGLRVNNSGEVTSIVPGKPAEEAGLYDGVQIMGVNGKKFSEERLKDAIADSVTTREIELLYLENENFETIIIPYADGPKFADLVPIEDKPNYLKEIFSPRTESVKNNFAEQGY